MHKTSPPSKPQQPNPARRPREHARANHDAGVAPPAPAPPAPAPPAPPPPAPQSKLSQASQTRKVRFISGNFSFIKLIARATISDKKI